MDNKDFVPFKTARKLKAAGFDEPCDHYWYKVYTDSDKMEMRQASVDDYNNDDWSVPHCSAPTLWQAQKWLREECGLHVDVGSYSDYSKDADGEVCDRWDFWGFDIYEVTGGKRLTDDDGEYDSYEAALSAGIDEALDLII